MAPPNFCFPLEKNGKNSGTSLPSQPRSAQLSGHLATSSGQFSSLTSRNENLHKSKYIYTLCGWYSIQYGMLYIVYRKPLGDIHKADETVSARGVAELGSWCCCCWSSGWWPFIINSCTLCRLQWPKLQLWQPQKGFAGAPTKRQRRMVEEGRQPRCGWIPGTFIKCLTRLNVLQRMTENGRQRRWGAEKDVKNVKYLTTWWTCQHTKPNEAWPTKPSRGGRIPSEFPSEVETRWLVNSGKLSAIQLRLSYTKCAATAIHPSIYPASQPVIHWAVLVYAHCIATWHNCKQQTRQQ